jgi:hypothetical protein
MIKMVLDKMAPVIPFAQHNSNLLVGKLYSFLVYKLVISYCRRWEIMFCTLLHFSEFILF